ncbi:MAG: class I SAM-dependent methyltransferase [Nitrospinae bacterium]|nr:class I SAM-dependent methyltransferase [Nitrospinota bacterium]
MKSEKIKKHFQKWAKDYDSSKRERIIPGFHDFYGAVVKMIPFKKGGRINILELGTGTGMLTEMILSCYSEAKLTGIDLTDEMLLQAERKLKRFKNRLILKRGDFSTTSFGSDYDAVISSLAIHHLTADGKKRVYKKIYKSLKKGGVFINADMVKSKSVSIQKTYLKLWEGFMRDGKVDEEYIKRRFHGAKKVDIYDTADEQLIWLKKAGFKDADVFYKYWNFAVFGGFKD